MKRLIPLLLSGVLAGLSTTSVTARVLSPTEALERVGSDESVTAQTGLRKAPSRLVLRQTVLTPVAEEPSLYIFTPDAGNGFIVASADDTFPAVIGYGDDNSVFDPEDIAPGFQWYLDAVAHSMEMVREGQATYDGASGYNSGWNAISPLIKTKWAQAAPYNYFVEDYASDAKTGCVATAMAQVMKFWEYPTKGTGSNSYTYNGTYFYKDFSKTTFEWSRMSNTYNSNTSSGSYPNNNEKAVATLMQACGISVEAKYKKGTTGAQTARDVYALTKYFGYSKSMRYYWRDYGFKGDDGQERWETMIYESLAKGRPVIYAGKSQVLKSGKWTEGGHSFICDGYSADGKFHFNWGWAGKSDGYFTLDALNPKEQGDGGSDGGYNYRQMCITDIVPADKVDNEDDYALQPSFMGYEGNMKWGVYPDDSSVGNCIYFHDGRFTRGVWNKGYDTISGEIYVVLKPWNEAVFYKNHGKRYYIIATVSDDFKVADGPDYFTLPAKLTGVPYWAYYVTLMYSDNSTASASSLDYAAGQLKPVIAADGMQDKVYMDVYNDGSFTVYNDGNHLTGVTDITVDGVGSGAVRRVVGLNGATIAVNPTDDELSALPAGLYLYVYDNGTRKVVK